MSLHGALLTHRSELWTGSKRQISTASGEAFGAPQPRPPPPPPRARGFHYGNSVAGILLMIEHYPATLGLPPSSRMWSSLALDPMMLLWE
jgi:hypothetical protein